VNALIIPLYGIIDYNMCLFIFTPLKSIMHYNTTNNQFQTQGIL